MITCTLCWTPTLLVMFEPLIVLMVIGLVKMRPDHGLISSPDLEFSLQAFALFTTISLIYCLKEIMLCKFSLCLDWWLTVVSLGITKSLLWSFYKWVATSVCFWVIRFCRYGKKTLIWQKKNVSLTVVWCNQSETPLHDHYRRPCTSCWSWGENCTCWCMQPPPATN